MIPISAASSGAIFPKEIAAQFPDALEHHRLRREIIATQLANSMINRGGPSLIVRIADQTGAAPAAIASAFAAVRDSYGMTALNTAIDELDNRIPGKLQLDLYAAVQDLLLDRIIWFLRNVELAKGLADVVAHYRDGIAAVAAALDDALSPECVERTRRAAERADGCRRAGGALPFASAISGRLRPRPTSSWSPTAPARRSAKSRQPISPPARSFGLDRIAERGEQHPDRRLFRPAGARSGAGFDRRCRAEIDRRDGRQRRRPAPAPSRLGWRRAKTRWNASAERSTRSPVPASRCRNWPSRRACLGIW